MDALRGSAWAGGVGDVPGPGKAVAGFANALLHKLDKQRAKEAGEAHGAAVLDASVAGAPLGVAAGLQEAGALGRSLLARTPLTAQANTLKTSRE